jgi:hypothetical protein
MRIEEEALIKTEDLELSTYCSDDENLEKKRSPG